MSYSMLVSNGVYMLVKDGEEWTLGELYNRFGENSDIYSVPLGDFTSISDRLVAVNEKINEIEKHGLDGMAGVKLVNV